MRMAKIIQAATWAATWAVIVWTFSSPGMLPEPLGRRVNDAVDEVARVCLWMWNEPTDALDGPDEWTAARGALAEWMLPKENAKEVSRVDSGLMAE